MKGNRRNCVPNQRLSILLLNIWNGPLPPQRLVAAVAQLFSLFGVCDDMPMRVDATVALPYPTPGFN
jgi:hypothetical protein